MFLKSDRENTENEVVDRTMQSAIIDLCEHGSIFVRENDVSLLLYLIDQQALVSMASILVEGMSEPTVDCGRRYCKISISQGCER